MKNNLYFRRRFDSESISCSVLGDSLRPHGLQPIGLHHPQNSPGRNIGVGSHALLQGTKPRSPTLQADSLQSEAPGKPVEIQVLMKLLERLVVCSQLPQLWCSFRELLPPPRGQGSTENSFQSPRSILALTTGWAWRLLQKLLFAARASFVAIGGEE